MYRRQWMITVLMVLCGCTAFQPQERPSAPLEIPTEFTLYNEGDRMQDEWWQTFRSEVLNGLVSEALTNNFDIRTAWARLHQAEAAARKVDSTLLPSINYEVGAKQQWIQSESVSGGTREHSDAKILSAGLAASYELDLWGRLYAQRQVGSFTFQSAREDLETAAMTVSAEIADTWIDVLATRQRITILRDQIKINTTLLDLQRLRFSNGKVRALDVSQQREVLAASKAELPLLELSERKLLHRLALLLGRTSVNAARIESVPLPEPIPLPASGMPAELLSSRPDIRAAGMRLHSADWVVAAARADRLPSIILSGQAAFSSGQLDLLFNNWVNSLAANIAGPLFDAGLRSAEVDRTRAVAEERLADYARIVAQAFKEVEDSMATETQQQLYLTLLTEQLQAGRLTLKNARLQYQNGQSDYLSYLTAWTGVQNLELKIIGEQAILLKNRIALYRALGGDWTGRLMERSPSSDNKISAGQTYSG